MRGSSKLEGEVLVLNSNYEPLNICNLRRALGLILLGKADVLHTDSREIHTSRGTFVSPSVVRLRYLVKRPRPELHLSRRSIFARDNYTCQYCGAVGGNLTVDHVVPKRLGGETSWENLVCCCRKCNAKKGDKTLEQAGMRLLRPPRKPKYIPFIHLTKYIEGKKHEIWQDYLPDVQDY